MLAIYNQLDIIGLAEQNQLEAMLSIWMASLLLSAQFTNAAIVFVSELSAADIHYAEGASSEVLDVPCCMHRPLRMRP